MKKLTRNEMKNLMGGSQVPIEDCSKPICIQCTEDAQCNSGKICRSSPSCSEPKVCAKPLIC